MGRQYNFAMDETDEKLFMQYLKESGYDENKDLWY